jgi:hypothetical protein
VRISVKSPGPGREGHGFSRCPVPPYGDGDGPVLNCVIEKFECGRGTTLGPDELGVVAACCRLNGLRGWMNDQVHDPGLKQSWMGELRTPFTVSRASPPKEGARTNVAADQPHVRQLYRGGG